MLDTELTPELIEEGNVREIVSKIQTMRKDAGFEVMDHILVSLNGNEKLSDIVARNHEMIATKVLADTIAKDQTYENAKEWNINGENVTICVQKVK